MGVIGTGIGYLPYGAVNFRPLPLESICGIESVWCQMVEQGDSFKAQIQMGEMTQLVTNGDFQATNPQTGWTGMGWSIVTTAGDNKMKHNTGNTNPLTQAAILTAGVQYKVTFTISDRTAGTVTSGGTASANGVYEFYFITIIAQVNLNFAPTTDFDGSIDLISCVQIEEDLTVVMLDSDDVVVYTFTAGADEINQFENHLRIEADWATMALADGCYSAAITDNEILIDEPFADNSAGWILDSTVTINANDLEFTPTIVETGEALLENVLEVGCSYEVIFNINALDIQHNVSVLLGTTQGTIHVAVGVKTQTIVANGKDLTIRFNNTDPTALTTSEVDYITLEKTSYDAVSDCFNLQDTWGCTKLFKWSNTGHWGGYNYEEWVNGTSFEHNLRHQVDFKTSSFPREKDFRQTSDGVNNLDYARMRRNLQMGVSRAKSYIHNAIAAFFSHDTSTIDDVAYVSEEDYDTSQNRTDMQTGRIEIGLKTQNLTNIKL